MGWLGGGLFILAAIWGASIWLESIGQMPVDADFDSGAAPTYNNKVPMVEPLDNNTIQGAPATTMVLGNGLQKKALSQDGLLAAMYLKTLLHRWGKQGILSLPLVQEAIGGGGWNGWKFGEEVVSRVGGALTPAVGALAGSASTALAGTAPLAPALAAIAALIQGSLDEESRQKQAAIAGAAVANAAYGVGLPPMSLISYLGAKDGGNLPYELITGQAGYLRQREWGPGIIARYVRAWNEINNFYIVPKDLPLLDPELYNREAKAARISVVFDNTRSILKPSRLFDASRYAFHPASLFGVSVVPKNQVWTDAYPIPDIGGKQYGIGGAAEGLRALRAKQKTDDFTIRREDLAVWLMPIGGYAEVYGSDGKWTQLPTTVSFEIGHDPGFERWVTPGMGLLPGGSGSITVARRDWRVVFTVDTNNGWLVTKYL